MRRRAEYRPGWRENGRRAWNPDSRGCVVRRIQNGDCGWKPLKKTAGSNTVALVVRIGNRVRGSGEPGKRAVNPYSVAKTAVRRVNRQA